MRIQVTNIHRRSNGTVDIDVYRRKALLLRRETTNQILRRLGRSVWPLIGAIAILLSYALLPRNPVPQSAVSKLAPARVSPLSDSLRASKSNHRSH
ncbi:MAG TPA: hypothetical protein VFL53_15745 [Pseudolabrys sp.]|nr:hypothetical protein [Pseudolabrys sp.]